jgi:hypothetical protein
MAAAVSAFMKTLAIEPPIKPGVPDPYLPPKPGYFFEVVPPIYPLAPGMFDGHCRSNG